VERFTLCVGWLVGLTALQNRAYPLLLRMHGLTELERGFADSTQMPEDEWWKVFFFLVFLILLDKGMQVED